MKAKKRKSKAAMKARKSGRRTYYAEASAAAAAAATSKAVVLASPSSSSTTTSVEDNHNHKDEDAAAVAVKSGSDMVEAVAAVESLLGYNFRDPRLLEEALTHCSHPSNPSYQRLEFVGDAVLGLALANHVFLTNPDVGPGRLSLIRAANISTEKLARVAVRHGLYAYLRRNVPHLDALVDEFSAAVAKEEAGDAEFAAVYGGSSVKAPKVLADLVESVAAAVYVDCGFDLKALWRVFRGVLEPIISADTVHDQPVSALNDFCQKQGLAFKFRNRFKGDRVTVSVFVDGQLLGNGCSDQKEIAKLNATRQALGKLVAGAKAGETESNTGDGGGGKKVVGGAKKMLNELCAKNHWSNPVYRVESEHGPPNNKRYVCSVRVETSDGTVHTASGDPKPRKKDSENVAAFNLLEQLNPQLPLSICPSDT